MPRASADTQPQPLSERIRNERKAQGLSPEGLAFKAGVSLKTVERLETGAAIPRRATLRVIVAALGLDPTEFGFWNGEAA